MFFPARWSCKDWRAPCYRTGISGWRLVAFLHVTLLRYTSPTPSSHLCYKDAARGIPPTEKTARSRGPVFPGPTTDATDRANPNPVRCLSPPLLGGEGFAFSSDGCTEPAAGNKQNSTSTGQKSGTTRDCGAYTGRFRRPRAAAASPPSTEQALVCRESSRSEGAGQSASLSVFVLRSGGVAPHAVIVRRSTNRLFRM